LSNTAGALVPEPPDPVQPATSATTVRAKMRAAPALPLTNVSEPVLLATLPFPEGKEADIPE
jgi:hypothetical protein